VLFFLFPGVVIPPPSRPGILPFKPGRRPLTLLLIEHRMAYLFTKLGRNRPPSNFSPNKFWSACGSELFFLLIEPSPLAFIATSMRDTHSWNRESLSWILISFIFPGFRNAFRERHFLSFPVLPIAAIISLRIWESANFRTTVTFPFWFLFFRCPSCGDITPFGIP